MRLEIKSALDRYARHGVPTGGFLRAVLANDLMESFGRADTENRGGMFEICSYVYNEIPGRCHGSYKIVDEWVERHRKKREKEADQ